MADFFGNNNQPQAKVVNNYTAWNNPTGISLDILNGATEQANSGLGKAFVGNSPTNTRLLSVNDVNNYLSSQGKDTLTTNPYEGVVKVNDPGRYNNAVNLMNEQARSAGLNDWSNLGGAYKKFYYYDKDRPYGMFNAYEDAGIRKGTATVGNYANGSGPASQFFNDYLNGNQFGSYANNDFNTYMNNAKTYYGNRVNELSDSTNDYITGKLNDDGTYAQEGLLSKYGQGNQYRNNLVNSKQNEFYNDAKSVIDRDYARGYLSGAGYQNALNELNNQNGTVNKALNLQADNFYGRALDDLKQYAQDKYFNTPDVSDAYGYLRNYGNYDNLANSESYQNMLDFLNKQMVDNYNDEALLGELTANSYNPDAYSATGANEQGVYNPFIDTGVTRKRMNPFSEIGGW